MTHQGDSQPAYSAPHSYAETAGGSGSAAAPAGASLGPALEAGLLSACGGRLSSIRWFRSDWQRGGGSTGMAVYQGDRGPVEVVVKAPVGPGEHRWTTALSALAEQEAGGAGGGPTPRVLAAGTSLGGWDLAWLVMEKLPGLPVGARLDARGIEDMLAATAEWHDRAEKVAPLKGEGGAGGAVGAPAGPNWDDLLHKSREVLKRARLSNSQHWNHEVHQVQRALPTLLLRWSNRPIDAWCHGDLHPGNAMRRAPQAAGNGDGSHLGACVLIDLALVHPGHWIEDALYFERVYWGRKELLRGVNLVSTLARIRRERGHHDGEDYGMLANVRRVLAAAAAPALLEREGNSKYLQHALELIPKLLPMVAH